MRLDNLSPAHAHVDAATKRRAFRNRSPRKILALVFTLTVPFWLVNAATDFKLMPGLSASALMTFCPIAAVKRM